MPIEIVSLHDRPAFIEACSAWAYGQWGVHSPRTLEETRLLFASAAHGSGLPLDLGGSARQLPGGHGKPCRQ